MLCFSFFLKRRTLCSEGASLLATQCSIIWARVFFLPNRMCGCGCAAAHNVCLCVCFLCQELERVTSLQTNLQLAAVICTNARRWVSVWGGGCGAGSEDALISKTARSFLAGDIWPYCANVKVKISLNTQLSILRCHPFMLTSDNRQQCSWWLNNKMCLYWITVWLEFKWESIVLLFKVTECCC